MRLSSFFAVLLLSVCFSACSGSKDEKEKDGALAPVGDSKPVAAEDLQFFIVSREVFAASCYECHNRAQGMIRGGIGTDVYEEVLENAQRIYQKAIVERTMPMNSSLTPRQYSLLKAWLEAGAPMKTELDYSNYDVEE
ncbi:hypothetical protein AZI85_06630 [Bdellovibrio bacteriovorus]|uniref:Cytochrome c domain-containing protein n=1 Tax=Bdellovibrio bacteriovorus TaxID=959 RepID=A0A150WG20_BDEBC|nr:hypothetical protein [Bdellovibrio bacteriovorus]KYG61883.1 hypothetical protein AZI85_06630 [Bdellovibrio bacteriovorus]